MKKSKVGKEWETKWGQRRKSGTRMGNKVGTSTQKWDKHGNKEWEQSGSKNPKVGKRMGTKWEQEPKSGTKMGTKWEQEPQKWEKNESKEGTKTYE